VAIASALLAGVLARFGLDAVTSVKTAPGLLLAMALAYLLGRRLWPRYAVPGVLLVGVAYALGEGRLSFVGMDTRQVFALPVWTSPTFTWHGSIGVALPLFIVTMASQNLPGVAAQRASGYQTPVSASIAVTGATTTLLAPFGGYAFNLAAITAAICLSREAHEDPARRYTASVAAGLVYLLVGLAGGAVAMLLAAFPPELVKGIAGLALLGTIASALATGLKDERQRDAAILTFLVCLSGVSFLGIGAAFWGVAAGGTASALSSWRRVA
jgi:benzoate membrane transport protein